MREARWEREATETTGAVWRSKTQCSPPACEMTRIPPLRLAIAMNELQLAIRVPVWEEVGCVSACVRACV